MGTGATKLLNVRLLTTDRGGAVPRNTTTFTVSRASAVGDLGFDWSVEK